MNGTTTMSQKKGISRRKLYLLRPCMCEIIQKKQALTFEGVNAHPKNVIAEHHIRHLQNITITQLIHASKIRKSSITSHLWPYALHMEIGAQIIHQAYIIHRDACHINYLLEPK